MGSSAWSEVYEIVRLIRRGHVMNYGQIAELCSRPLTPRAIGWALNDCPDDVPWHRVVNAAGGCSTDLKEGSDPGRQRALLEAEGVAFGSSGHLEIEKYRFDLDVDDLVEMLAEDEDD